MTAFKGLGRATVGALLIAGSLALSPACVERGRIYARIGPPAPVVEVRTVSPGGDYVWIDGYQRWDGNNYGWVAGHWERPPHARAVWQAGRWQRDGHGWYYVQGHWRG